MLTKRTMWLVPALLSAAGALLGACGSSGGAASGTGSTTGSGVPMCVPGSQQACLCGKNIFQTCSADGTYSPCQCGSGAGGASTGATTGSGKSATTGGSACGDGIPSKEKCDPASEFYCPQDCVAKGTGGMGGTGGSGGSCVGKLTYAGAVGLNQPNTNDPVVPSAWGMDARAMGGTGLDAGNSMCQMIGADHVCEFAEVKKALAAGELSKVPAGTTAWLHRTTIQTVTPADELGGGMMSQPGPGGRCNDWTYHTAHLSDGEHVDFVDPANPVFFVDNDTIFDPTPPTTPGPHTHHFAGAVAAGVDDLPCGSAPGGGRAILCCYPKCM